jgi:NTP pyrophosphatase (non-canonical NTP hydrolase)
MKTNNLEQLELSIKASLSKIQNEFEYYQKNFFMERSPEFFCLELNGEAGELANLEKKQWKGRDIEPERFSDEAADVFIALINYSNARGVDLESAVINKLNKIENIRQERADNGLTY